MKRYRFGRLSVGWQIMIGLTLGVICGLVLYQNKGAITIMQSLEIIFIRLIRMIVMSIVISCLTVEIANIGDIRKLGRIGRKALVYFEVSTTIVLVSGVIMVSTTHLGSFIDIHKLRATDISQYMSTAKSAGHSSGLWSLTLSITPANILKSISDGDMMPVILFSVLFGLRAAAVGEKAEILIDVSNAVSEVMSKVANWVMKFASIGVFDLIGITTAEMGISTLLPLGLFIVIAYVTVSTFVIVVLGITAHIFHLRYWKTMCAILDEIVSTFTAASSEITLPRLTERTYEMGVSKGITAFVIPTGYTFNLDESAVCQLLAAIFLVQAYGLHLSTSYRVTLLVALMTASKGMAGAPGASFVVLFVSASAIGAPMAGLTLIIRIDHLVDMGWAVVGVAGNSITTLIIDESEGTLDHEKHNTYLGSYGREKPPTETDIEAE